MKNLKLLAMVIAFICIGCSDDDGPKCDSCTSEAGKMLEICDNGDGTYSTYTNGKLEETITKEELEGEQEGLILTPKQIVELACAADLPL